MKKITLAKRPCPSLSSNLHPISLSDVTMEERKMKILKAMRKKELDVICVYADREHYGNFKYLTGFAPRFEEAVLVLHVNGEAYLILGNEMLKMSNYSRIKAEGVLCPYFSLPDQPMTQLTMQEIFEKCNINDIKRTGLVGWKRFTAPNEDNLQLYDIPYFIVETVKNLTAGNVINAADIFIHPSYGARITMNANEIAHYEYGAALASDCVLNGMNNVKPQMKEYEAGSFLGAHGQQNSVQTICAAGERFTNGEVSPRNKIIELGDKFSITAGFAGGLSSRSAYIADSVDDLCDNDKDYVGEMAMPYFRAAVAWYESMGCNVAASDIYNLVHEQLLSEEFNAFLNPGHYVADEEWLASPMKKDSDTIICSGMLLQMDIIPSKTGYSGASAEDGIAIMDDTLAEELKCYYPDVYDRMLRRQRYMKEVIGINVSDEVYPLSDICGYYRPYILNSDLCLAVL